MSNYVALGEAEGHIQRLHGGMRVFLIFVVIVMVVFFVVFSVNAFFYNEVRKKSCGSTISQGEGNVMFWINVILAIISGVGAILGILFVFYSHSETPWRRTYIAIPPPPPPTPEEELVALRGRERGLEEEIVGQAAREEAVRQFRLQRFVEE